MSLCADVTILNRGVKIRSALGWASPILRFFVISGFPSKRINLSPFTKDFRGGEHSNESYAFLEYSASAEFINT